PVTDRAACPLHRLPTFPTSAFFPPSGAFRPVGSVLLGAFAGAAGFTFFAAARTLRLALGGGRGPVRVRLGVRLRFGGGLGGFLFLLLAGLVGLAAVVGLVEARPLEDDGRARAEDAVQLVLLALRALGQRRLREVLELVEVVAAGVALVFVGWHGWFFLLVSPRPQGALSRALPAVAAKRL